MLRYGVRLVSGTTRAFARPADDRNLDVWLMTAAGNEARASSDPVAADPPRGRPHLAS